MENQKSLTTKELILYCSLNLFAKDGYEAASMRMISKEVGIRESSIYKHYASKQEILNAITQLAIEETDKMFIDLKVPDIQTMDGVAQFKSMDIDAIAEMCTNLWMRQMENEIIVKFRRMLTIEQYRNESLRNIFYEKFMDKQLTYIEAVFNYLKEAKVLKGESAKSMALQFYAPFFMLQYKMNAQDSSLQEELKAHAVHFIMDHMA